MRAVAGAPPTDIRAQVGRLMDFATGEHDGELKVELAAIVGGIQGPAATGAVSLPDHQPAEGPVAIAIRPEPIRARAGTALGGA